MIFPLLSLATVALALPSQRPKFSSRAFTNTSCTTSGVHMIVARGSTETTPIGTLLAPLVDGIEQYLPGSDAVGIDYPASLVAYSESVAIGVAGKFSPCFKGGAQDLMADEHFSHDCPRRELRRALSEQQDCPCWIFPGSSSSRRHDMWNDFFGIHADICLGKQIQ